MNNTNAFKDLLQSVVQEQRMLDQLNSFNELHIMKNSLSDRLYKDAIRQREFLDSVSKLNSVNALVAKIEAQQNTIFAFNKTGRIGLNTGRTGLLTTSKIHNLTKISEEMARFYAPYDFLDTKLSVWAQTLEAQMSAINNAWISPNSAAISFEGFAKLSRLGHIIKTTDPFSIASREEIDTYLGKPINITSDASAKSIEKKQLNSGISSSLLIISSEESNQVFVQTGFKLIEQSTPPSSVENENTTINTDPCLHSIFTCVERNLRKFISDQLQLQYGSSWLKQGVNGNIIKEWKVKKEDAIDGGEPSLELIQYSNFIELKDIILEKNNWNDLFNKYFKNKNSFEASMNRLSPVRKALSHSRPLCGGHKLQLIAESNIILKAMSIDLFRIN